VEQQWTPEWIEDGTDDEDTGSDREERPNNRRRLLIGTAVAAVLTCGVSGAFFGPLGWRIMQQKDASLNAPAKIGDLALDESPSAKEAADDLRTAFAAPIDFESTVGAVYKDPADQARRVMVLAGTAIFLRPERELDNQFEQFENMAGTGRVTDVKPVPAGKLGGVMKCGTTSIDGTPMAVCGWADHGSIAVTLFPARSAADSAKLMPSIREAVQHRK